MPDTNGAIYGIVTEDGVVKVGCPVVLMSHTELRPIAETVTDVNGGYAFLNLDPESTDYMVFTVDNDGNPKKSALMLDYVQPSQTANGNLAGNFPSYLDSLAPDLSLVAYQQSGTNGVAWNNCRLVRGSGNACSNGANTDYGTLSNWRQELTPVPTAAGKIIAADTTGTRAGWQCGPMAWPLWDNLDASCPRSNLQPALSFMIFHRVTTNGAGYAVTYNHLSDQDGDSAWRVRSRTDYEFYNQNGYYYSRDTFFNVVFENNGDLRIKYLQSNGGSPIRKNFLITTLPNTSNKFYIVVVRYGELTTDFIYVDVTDTTTGVKTSYTTGVARGTLHQSTEYGSVVTNGPRRHGIYVGGPHQNADGNFNSWDGTNGFGWNNSRWPDAVKAEYGPLAFWNRKLTDTEVANLSKAACDTTTTWRVYPRYLSELFSNGPMLYVPNDEFPGNWTRNQKQGHKRRVRAMGRWNLAKKDLLSARRRKVITPGGPQCIENISVLTDERWSFVCTAKRTDANYGVLFENALVNTTSYQTTEFTGSSQDRFIYVAIDGNGKVRVIWRGASGRDDYYTSATAIAVGQTVHIAFVCDSYTGLTQRLYINGVLAQSIATSQGTAYVFYNGYDSYNNASARLTIMADGYWTGMSISGRDREPQSVLVADLAFFHNILSAASITELYNAWVIAMGTDSQA